MNTSPSAARTVQVNPAALAGRPVSAVRRHLTRAGLRVRVTWQASGHQRPGTVISVQPAGQVPVGATVLITGALAPAGHGHATGHAHGKGNGKGD